MATALVHELGKRQRLADEANQYLYHGMPFTPGTSKWNKIEHRLFCHITQKNWRGRPLVTYETVAI